MSVKSAGAEQPIEGKELARSLEKMVDFKRYCERATRRLGGDAQLLNVLLESLSGRKGILRKEGFDAAKGLPGRGVDGQDRRGLGQGWLPQD